MKLQPATTAGVRTMLLFWCPGCEEPHGFRIAPEPDAPNAPVWTWNGDLERPTFAPSLVVTGNRPAPIRCHLFLRDGRIEYLGDCSHKLAGATIDLPEWE